MFYKFFGYLDFKYRNSFKIIFLYFPMESINIKQTEWNLDLLKEGKDFEEKRKDWENETDNFISKWKDREDYLENPLILKKALDEFERWEKFFGSGGDELYYFRLKRAQDQENPEVKAKYNKIEEFSKNVEKKMSFFTLNMAKIPKEKQEKFLQDNELKEYRHFLNRLFENARYLLSENEEKIMNLKSTSAHSSWVKMVSEFLYKEEKEVLDEDGNLSIKTLSDLFSLIDNKNKEVRDKAAKAINEILEKYSEVAEAEINAVLMNKKVNDEIRGFDRPDKSRHISDDIDSEIVDSIVDAISSNLDISKEYYDLKSKLLGVEKLEYHERNVRYGSIDKTYSYEDTVKLVNKVFSDLDKKFADLLKMFVENGQIDVYPKKGKSGGAFCAYSLKSQPTYILLNHSNKLRNVETLAHELGHAINNELVKEKQNSLNFGTTLGTAEVASTFMEDFVLDELRKEADEELKLALMMQKLNGDVSSIIRQISCYKFEQELHKNFGEKGYLSKEEIGKLFQKYMSSYMGDFVEQSQGSENWWIYWGHIRTFFYNYSYASGLLISKALQRKVRENPEFIEKVKEFLSAGVSKSPRDIFLDLGLDISKKEFWEEELKEIRAFLKDTKELAEKLGKI